MKEDKSKSKRFELKANDTNFPKVKITGSNEAKIFAMQFFGDDIEIYESFFLILLNRANNTIGYVKISQGGVCGTVVDVKIIAKYAIESLCSSVILIHNHPSGNTAPSGADKTITSKIKDGLKLFDISVLDHLILTSESYFSFADEGLI